MIEEGSEYHVKITAKSTRGSGIAEIDGFPVFIPETTPGNEADIIIEKVFPDFAIGRIKTRAKPANKGNEVERQ